MYRRHIRRVITFMSVTALALLHIPVQLVPLRPAAAAAGSWTQTDWTTIGGRPAGHTE